MSQLIPFKTDSGHTILIETEGFGLGDAAREGEEVVEGAVKSLSNALEPVKSVSQSIFNAFSDFAHAPDEVEIELSIKLSAEAGVIITKASAEGNFKIALKWEKAKKVEIDG